MNEQQRLLEAGASKKRPIDPKAKNPFVENNILKKSLLNLTPIKITSKPWGHESLIIKSTPNIQLKLLHIKKDEQLSLQYHNNKAEFLICLQGKATAFGTQNIYCPGDYLYLAPKTIHRITALDDCVFVELSQGKDSDIVRLDDKYGRP